MDTNMKQRGQKQHKNKARYQNKSKVVSKQSDLDHELQESNSKIQNNWDRYEESSDAEEVDNSTNFSILAQAPLSHSGYFQFKSQKDVQSQGDFDRLQTNKMFSLNLDLLSLCIGTVPFHKRCNINEDFLEEEDIKNSESQATDCLIAYDNYMAFVKPTSNVKGEEEISLTDSCHTNEHLLEDIDKLNLKENTSNVIDAQKDTESNRKINKESDKETEDLEQWLNDFLDD